MKHWLVEWYDEIWREWYLSSSDEMGLAMAFYYQDRQRYLKFLQAANERWVRVRHVQDL